MQKDAAEEGISTPYITGRVSTHTLDGISTLTPVCWPAFQTSSCMAWLYVMMMRLTERRARRWTQTLTTQPGRQRKVRMASNAKMGACRPALAESSLCPTPPCSDVPVLGAGGLNPAIMKLTATVDALHASATAHNRRNQQFGKALAENTAAVKKLAKVEVNGGLACMAP